MPIYFGDVAPYCPVSRDSPLGPESAPSIRTSIPPAYDLASAIAAANLARSILVQIVSAKTINNVFTPPSPAPRSPQKEQTVDKRRHARWQEDTSARVFRRYKYYLVDSNGDKDPANWVMTQRIERMVWNDRAWKTSMVWSYGDKGEGEPVDGGGGSSADGSGAPGQDDGVSE